MPEFFHGVAGRAASTAACSVEEAVDGLLDYARQRYDGTGWDALVECYTRAELIELLRGRVGSVRGAVQITSRGQIRGGR